MSDKHHQYGKFYSWTIFSETVAVKETDTSFFNHKESGVPMEIRWFFDADHFPDKKRDIPVRLLFRGQSYDAHLNLHKLGKVRIIWYADLDKELNKYYHGGTYPLARFEKVGSDKYSIEFMDDIENALVFEKDGSDPLESVYIPQVEGMKKAFYVTRYERNKENRRNAILIHGTRCMICGFDFASVYGEAGVGFIEVHHIKPLADKDEITTVNPETDLVCLCSNCHSIIHRKKNGVYTVEEVRKMVKKQSADL